MLNGETELEFNHNNDNTKSTRQIHYRNMNNQMPRDNYPLRILLNSELVGAVIGRGGEKIKEITTRTSARVDVKRELVPWCQLTGSPNLANDFSYMTSRMGYGGAGSGGMNDSMMLHAPNSLPNKGKEQSQVVFIYGSPEGCSEACKEIMTICRDETSESNGDPKLGILAEDRFCGRIIGREGKNLSSIKQTSGAHITISNSQTVTTLSQDHKLFSVDRIVIVKGDINQICEAEKLISAKLRLCHQQEAQKQPNFNNPSSRLLSQSNNFNAASPMVPLMCNIPSMPPYFPLTIQSYPGMNQQPAMTPYYQPFVQPNLPSYPPPPNQYDVKVFDDTVYMKIPHQCAGAIIGTDGVSIKKLMEDTKTYVNVGKNSPDGSEESDSSQRIVTIRGNSAGQTKAQWYIFQRVKAANRSSDHEVPVDSDLKLCTMVRVPRKLIGRLIGRNGRVIQNIQSVTGTSMSLPKLNDSSSSTDYPESDDLQTVEVIGNFDCTQHALAYIRTIVQQSLYPPQPQLGPTPCCVMVSAAAPPLYPASAFAGPVSVSARSALPVYTASSTGVHPTHVSVMQGFSQQQLTTNSSSQKGSGHSTPNSSQASYEEENLAAAKEE